MMVSRNGRADAIRILICEGANINQKNCKLRQTV
jgi:hypothetical protein